jgi:hypothetical protein
MGEAGQLGMDWENMVLMVCGALPPPQASIMHTVKPASQICQLNMPVEPASQICQSKTASQKLPGHS